METNFLICLPIEWSIASSRAKLPKNFMRKILIITISSKAIQFILFRMLPGEKKKKEVKLKNIAFDRVKLYKVFSSSIPNIHKYSQ